LPICTRLTDPNMKPLLAAGHRSMPWAEVMEAMYKWFIFIVICVETWSVLLFWCWFKGGFQFRKNG
jgi:hypothetical protein